MLFTVYSVKNLLFHKPNVHYRLRNLSNMISYKNSNISAKFEILTLENYRSHRSIFLVVQTKFSTVSTGWIYSSSWYFKTLQTAEFWKKKHHSRYFVSNTPRNNFTSYEKQLLVALQKKANIFSPRLCLTLKIKSNGSL